MADVTLVSFGAGRGACDEIVSCFHFCPLVCSFLSFARSLALARARARATDCTNEFVPAHIVAAWLAKRLKARRAPCMLSLSPVNAPASLDAGPAPVGLRGSHLHKWRANATTRATCLHVAAGIHHR